MTAPTSSQLFPPSHRDHDLGAAGRLCWLILLRAGVVAFMILVAVGFRFPVVGSRPQNRVVMSLQPRPWPEVPAQTAQVAKKAFRRGALAIRARDELGAWYDDAGFAGG